MFQDATLLSLPVAVAFARAFVVLLLAFGERDFTLHLVAFPVERCRYAGVALLARVREQPSDLLFVQQQLADSFRVGDDVRRRTDQRRYCGAVQECLAVADHHEAVNELRLAAADALQLPAVQRNAGFEAIAKLVVEPRTTILRDGSRRFGFGFGHARDYRGA